MREVLGISKGLTKRNGIGGRAFAPPPPPFGVLWGSQVTKAKCTHQSMCGEMRNQSRGGNLCD